MEEDCSASGRCIDTQAFTYFMDHYFHKFAFFDPKPD